MRNRPRQKGSLLLLLGGVLLCVVSLFYLFTAGKNWFSLPNGPSAPSVSITQVPTIAITPQPACKQQTFQTGVVFPRWSPQGYGNRDTQWLTQLADIRKQTGACWLEMPILFIQDTASSTTIHAGPSTPTLDSFTYGIRFAHALGYHIFVTPLVHIQTGPRSWAGMIQFPAYEQEQQWFEGYWQFLKPYVTAAAETGVEQLAIGTEEDWLQNNAPDSLWNGLIANMHSVFPGTLSYDSNWTSLQTKPPAWMHNPDLKMIGASAYLALEDTPARVDPKQIPALWKEKAQPILDNFASMLGKPLFLSEVGYRNSSDSLYTPWKPKTDAPPDPEEQAGVYDAVLINSLADPNILGSFFWAWEGAGALNIKGQPAVSVLHNRYAPLQA